MKLAIREQDEFEFAIKILKYKNKEKFDMSYFKEVLMMASFQHHNIVQIKNYGECVILKQNGSSYEAFYILMDVAKNGEIMAYIKQ